MKKQLLTLPIALAFLVFLTAGSCQHYPNKTTPEFVKKTYEEDQELKKHGTIRILSWNLQIFGTSKANDPAKMKIFEDTMKKYDIIFIQEIRDASGTAFEKLCNDLPDYECICSSRAGPTSSKEQYGAIYRKDLKLIKMTDYNPDALDRWDRPAAAFTLNKNGYIFTVYVVHFKPAAVLSEIKNLEQIVENRGNVIVLGDLNADCKYYKNVNEDFRDWTWLIKDSFDTTTGKTDCAYDRIIVNGDQNKEVMDSGVVYCPDCPHVSDHYPVYVEILDKDK